MIGVCAEKFKRADAAQFAPLDFVPDHEVPAQPHPHALDDRLIGEGDLIEGGSLHICLVLQAKMFEPVAPVHAVPARCIQLDQGQALQVGGMADIGQREIGVGNRVDFLGKQQLGTQG